MTIRDTPFYRKLAALVARQEKEQGEGCGLTDALANLRHIADDTEQDYGACDSQAHQHYLTELRVMKRIGVRPTSKKSEVMTAGGKK